MVLLDCPFQTAVDAVSACRTAQQLCLCFSGEIQGTVHRRLLEDRQGELKAGAVLLLKQVSPASP